MFLLVECRIACMQQFLIVAIYSPRPTKSQNGNHVVCVFVCGFLLKKLVGSHTFWAFVRWVQISTLLGPKDFTLGYGSLAVLKIGSLRCPSNAISAFKIYLSQNNPSKRNPKLKMNTSLEVLNIIYPPKERTSAGYCHYKNWS